MKLVTAVDLHSIVRKRLLELEMSRFTGDVYFEIARSIWDDVTPERRSFVKALAYQIQYEGA